MASSLRLIALYTRMSNYVTIVTTEHQMLSNELTEFTPVVAGQTLIFRYSHVVSVNGIVPDLTDISPTALPTNCYTC